MCEGSTEGLWRRWGCCELWRYALSNRHSPFTAPSREAEVYRQWSEMRVIYFVSRPWNDPATVPESINGMRGDPRCGRAVGLALTPSAAQWYSRYPPRSPQSRKAIFRKLNSHHRGHRELTETDNNYIDRSKTMPRFFSVRSVSSW